MKKSAFFGEEALTAGTSWLVIVLIATMVVVIWISVFTRYVLADPISWGEQVAKYLMIWATFLGSSIGFRRGAHVAVDLFVNMLPTVLAKLLGWVSGALVAGFLCLCIYYGTVFSYNVIGHSDPLVGEMSMAIPYSAIPVGSLLMLIQLTYLGLHGTLGRHEPADSQASVV